MQLHSEDASIVGVLVAPCSLLPVWLGYRSSNGYETPP
jgi:hypothetical protein